MRVFESGIIGEKRERQDCNLILLQSFVHLKKEIQLLNNKKKSLQKIEEQLWLMIYEDIKYRIRKNQDLRLEVKKQKANCMELARGLNASIRADCSKAFW